MHWNSAFGKESQCNYVHTDEDCYIHLQWKAWRYSKCRDIQGHTGTEKDRQGHTGTEKGQTGTYRDRKGQTGTYRDRQGQGGTSKQGQGQEGTIRDRKGMSLLVPTLSLLVPALPACPCLSLLVPGLSLASTNIIGKLPKGSSCPLHLPLIGV